MRELRKDPIVGRWVIFSIERSRRPSDFPLEAAAKRGGPCPFCPGQEESTPSEVLAYRSVGSAPNAPGWQVRVVPNRYPALGIEGALDERTQGLFEKMNGIGAHEVIIETPDHHASLATLPLAHIEAVLWAFRDRTLDLMQDTRFCSLQIFKNHGAAAGASLEHPHSQLIALPIVPKRLQEELTACAEYYRRHGGCLFCALIQQDMQLGERVVVENAAFVALTPFASRFPFEVCLLPKTHAATFERASREIYHLLAAILREVLRRIHTLLQDPPYNLMLHSAPWTTACDAYYHWHLELTPRLTRVAGFEWGTGFYINPTLPEEAARFLRDVPMEQRD